MTPNLQRESLEEAFKRIRGVDASLGEQLQAFAESSRHGRPEFAAAIDRLIERLRSNGAGESAPHPGDPMPFIFRTQAGTWSASISCWLRAPWQ